MGFFSDLVDVAPHRTVAFEIKDYCSSTSLNDKEQELVRNNGINEQQLIWLRNSYNFCVFQAFFVVMNEKYPNSYFSITKSFLDGIITDVFYSKYAIAMFEELDVPLPSSYGLWNDYFDDYCERIERNNTLDLAAHIKYQLQGLTNGYQNEIAEFIKERTNKLKKPL